MAKQHTARWITLGGWALVPLFIACEATPIPEPPALTAPEPDRIALGAGAEVTTDTSAHGIEVLGAPGAAPPGSTLSATVLDTTAAPTLTRVADDGSFRLAVTVVAGAELRLESLRDSERSAPLDLRYVDGTLEPVERAACVRLEPGLSLPLEPTAVGATSTAELIVVNDCAATLTLVSAELRLDPGDLTVTADLPVDLDPGTSAPLTLDYSPTAAGSRVDVVLLAVTVDGTPVRYPVTVWSTDR